jgi:hypothetical protein
MDIVNICIFLEIKIRIWYEYWRKYGYGTGHIRIRIKLCLPILVILARYANHPTLKTHRVVNSSQKNFSMIEVGTTILHISIFISDSWFTLGHKPVISLFVSIHPYSTSILSAFVFANIHIHICIRFENMKHIHGNGTIQVSILRGFLLL